MINKIACIVHMYPFTDGEKTLGFAGGEMYLHRLNKVLVDYGHQVDVFVVKHPTWPACTQDRPEAWSFEGISVKMLESHKDFPTNYDKYITHLCWAMDCIEMCKRINKECYFIVHNTYDYPCVTDNPSVHVIYNSNNSKRMTKFQKNNGFVLPPLLDTKFWKVETNEAYITFINPHPKKGGQICLEVARRMPMHKFLCVSAGYYEDECVKVFPPNVTVIPQ